MSDAVLLAIIGGIVTVTTTVFGGAMTYFMYKLQRQGEAIHTLVNSNMGAQLRISAVALRNLANETKNADDAGRATEAERLLEDHISKQAVVDATVSKKEQKN